MENGWGFFGIEVSTAALNITHYNRNGTVHYTYNIAGGDPPTNVPPVATVSATPTTGNIPLTVNFGGTGSTDSDGNITSYAWNFGDGGTATGSTTSHTYTTAGAYSVVLTVTDNDGATDTADVTITATDPGARECGPGGRHRCQSHEWDFSAQCGVQ